MPDLSAVLRMYMQEGHRCTRSGPPADPQLKNALPATECRQSRLWVPPLSVAAQHAGLTASLRKKDRTVIREQGMNAHGISKTVSFSFTRSKSTGVPNIAERNP